MYTQKTKYTKNCEKVDWNTLTRSTQDLAHIKVSIKHGHTL